jgi:hypothetical protein
MIDQEQIKCIAIDNGYELAEIQPDEHYLRFVKEGTIIDVWYTNTVRIIKNDVAKYYRDNDYEKFLLLFKL